jgi:hypothetical protein
MTRKLLSRRNLLVGAGVALAGGGATAVEVQGMGSMAAYTARAAATRAPLADNVDLRELVRFATLAPSGHNTQPWRFRLAPKRIGIAPDRLRRTPAVDPDDHHLFVGLGCAVENLALAARARGLDAVATLDAVDRLTVELASSSRDESPLARAIPTRQSTRATFDGRPVPSADLRLVRDAARLPGVEVVLITDRSSLEKLLKLVVAGNEIQMADAAFIRELKSWIRFNPRAAMDSGDGLFSATSGSPDAPSWLGALLFDHFYRLKAENEKYTEQVRSSAGVAVFLGAREDHASWIDVGRSCQRFALQATALGIRSSFINQPIEVAALRPALAGLVGAPGRRPDLVMRFGYGPTLPYSLRRPVEAVFEG